MNNSDKAVFSSLLSKTLLSKSLIGLAALFVSHATFAYEFINTASSSTGSNATSPGTHDAQVYRGSVITPITSTGTISYGLDSNSANGAATSSANAVLGAVHALSVASAEVTNTSGCCLNAQGQTSAFSEYNDIFVINSGGYAKGTVATFTASVLLHGSLASSGSPDVPYPGNGVLWDAQSGWRSSVVVGSQSWVSSLSADGASWYPTSVTGDGVFGTLTLSTQIVLGENTTFVIRAETRAAAGAMAINGTSRGVSFSDLGNTLSWQGISSLKINGQTVDDFTALSETSGFDFRKSYTNQVTAVPEPETYAMLLAGLGLMGVIARRRKQK